jgi:SAM-dependent methyltransferase
LAIPSDEELLRYYRRHYRRDYHGAAAPSAHRVVRAWRRGADLLRLLGPYLPAGGEVFEIGAGIGCTVKQFELAGFTASGIEPGAAFQEFAHRRLLARVTTGSWSQLAPVGRFDLVLLVHVIEHLGSPRTALAHVRRWLSPRGRVYVECPNLYSPHAAPRRLFHPAHVYNFTPATLSLLAARCGYRVEESLSHPRDRNLRVLLSRAPRGSDVGAFDSLTDSYSQTIEALCRYNTLTYHLRWCYARERLRGLLADASDHWRAAQRVEAIIAQCRRHSKKVQSWDQALGRAA